MPKLYPEYCCVLITKPGDFLQDLRVQLALIIPMKKEMELRTVSVKRKTPEKNETSN